MSEINIRIKAEALGKSLENLSYEAEQELQEAIGQVVQTGYESIVSHAQLLLRTSRQDYLSGLSFAKLGPNDYLILLDGKYPNAIEAGYSGFDVKQGMLNSKKIVEIGPRSGLPWVQKSAEDGHRYAHVPFQHRPFSREAKTSDMSQAIRKLKAYNRQGVEQKFTKIFKDANGSALEGKVATVQKVKGFPDLDRITKYQKKYKNEKTGKETIQSIYMTYRTVSEHGGEWTHPGWRGLHGFDEAEKYIDSEIDNILSRILT